MTDIFYKTYVHEDLPNVISLVSSELSEPYVIYTFRYFLHQWPHLAFLAYPGDPTQTRPVGVIVCKQSTHKNLANRGYIAMLSVDRQYRKRGIDGAFPASSLVRHSVDAMKLRGVEEIALETEYDNHAALSLYESLGFIREKRLHRFYLNGKDAFRLILVLHSPNVDTKESGLFSSSGGPRSLEYDPYRSVKVYDDSSDDDEVSCR